MTLDGPMPSKVEFSVAVCLTRYDFGLSCYYLLSSYLYFLHMSVIMSTTIEALIDISPCCRFSFHSVSLYVSIFFMIIPFHMFTQNSALFLLSWIVFVLFFFYFSDLVDCYLVA
jgi:hypothetical protein